MKKILKTTLISLLVLSVSSAFALDLDLSGKLELEVSQFFSSEQKKKSTFGKFSLSPELEISSNKSWLVKIAADLRAGDPKIYRGTDLIKRDSDKTFVVLKEFYLDTNPGGKLLVRIGKQYFRGGIAFDSVDFNPFGARDLSEPFSSLDNDRTLGVWGVSAKTGSLEFIISGHNNSVLATHFRDRWTRDLSLGLSYGSSNIETDANFGLRINGTRFIANRNVDWGLDLYHGAANAVDHLNIGNKVHPVFPEQTSVGLSSEFPVGEINVRLGLINHWQEDAENFMPWAVEIERLWEGVFSGNDNLIVEIGFSDVAKTSDSGVSTPELDIRRIYEGGSLIAISEYSPKEEWTFKIEAVYNLKERGTYIAPKIVWVVSDSIELTLKGELINGRSSDKPFQTLWSEHENDDRIMTKLVFYF